MKFHAIVDKDGFRFTGSRAWVKSKLSTLEPGEWDVVFRRHQKQRSNLQNRYYWGVVVPLVYQGLRDNGYNEVMDHEDAHEILKTMFFTKTIFSHERGEITMATSTTKFSTLEFAERMELIWQWSQDFLNVYIPPPNTQTALDFEAQQ